MLGKFFTNSRSKLLWLVEFVELKLVEGNCKFHSKDVLAVDVIFTFDYLLVEELTLAVIDFRKDVVKDIFGFY